MATSLFNAFQSAKEIALESMYNQRALRYMMPWLMRDIDEIHEVFDGDPWPYGVEPNRPTLEALVQYLQDQHLIDWQPKLEELFAPIYGQDTRPMPPSVIAGLDSAIQSRGSPGRM